MVASCYYMSDPQRGVKRPSGRLSLCVHRARSRFMMTNRVLRALHSRRDGESAMKLLVLGGTVFVGRHVVQAALDAGHEVTIFTRGQTNPSLFPEAEHLRGDRNGHLEALRGRRWDAVLDPSGFVPRTVRMSAELLRDTVDRYVFMSTLSVYRDLSRPYSEADKICELDDPQSEDIEANYGALKAACERVLHNVFGDRATYVRAGMIVGPNDPTQGFTYWALRLRQGGRVLAPGDPERPIQLIDVRDLSLWLLRLAKRGPGGAMNVTGPASMLPIGDALRRLAVAVAGEAQLVWVDEKTLLAAGVRPWTELPFWLSDPKVDGVFKADISRALGAGLTLRPLEDTARDTLAWARTAGEQQRMLSYGMRTSGTQQPMLSPEKELQVLARYRKGILDGASI
jgi:2'-hydroxyisoflavone reductase